MVFYFRKGTKKAVTKFVTAFLWTSQGLNLGPPDYESQMIDFQKLALHFFSGSYSLISKPKGSISFSNNLSCFLLFS